MHRQGSTKNTNAKQNNEIVVSVDAVIEELIPEFLKRKRRVISQWNDLLERGDYGALANLGHDLDGTSGAYGFTAISEIGHSLQLAAEKKDHKEAQRLVEEYSSYLSRLRVVYS